MTAQIELRSRKATTGLLDQHRDQQPLVLRRMQSRNLLSVTFDNIMLGLKFCFDKFAGAMATVMAGILKPKQARSVSIYLAAFLIAILMLAFCRELNMYCFLSVARNNCATAPKANSNHSMLSNSQRSTAL